MTDSKPRSLHDTVSAVGGLLRLLQGSTVSSLHLEDQGVSVHIERRMGPVTEDAPAESGLPDETGDASLMPAIAPAVGVFHTCPAPDEAPFIQPGERVTAGQQIGLVEAMKMFTPVLCPVAGVLQEVLVADGQIVEYEQPVALVKVETAQGDPPGAARRNREQTP
ncbi:acetyl-CoA carboxylase biotin carboxyl carrier protein [Spirillospora sp. NPDC048911]|uniref:acetyl-CoA carboxylase biotin carboxyl carrier protein n=1 Tax=Spirillospora sp. NPDC048911 TaxID=3364527 RepID=UPI00371F42BF